MMQDPCHAITATWATTYVQSSPANNTTPKILQIKKMCRNSTPYEGLCTYILPHFNNRPNPPSRTRKYTSIKQFPAIFPYFRGIFTSFSKKSRKNGRFQSFINPCTATVGRKSRPVHDLNSCPNTALCERHLSQKHVPDPGKWSKIALSTLFSPHFSAFFRAGGRAAPVHRIPGCR